MAGQASETLKEMNARFSTFAKATPQVFGAFRSLMNEASKDGSLPARFKELVAVAIAVNQGCEDCIVFHLASAQKHGASRQELIEVLGVAVEMGGGPGSVYAAKALAAFDDMASAGG
jgi:AhpD family alkylhydroperoxidase